MSRVGAATCTSQSTLTVHNRRVQRARSVDTYDTASATRSMECSARVGILASLWSELARVRLQWALSGRVPGTDQHRLPCCHRQSCLHVGPPVQHYIRRPLLINGFKFDMRVYVAVTSLQPLRVYIYENGLVRFATTPYTVSKSSLKDKGIHLTNVSINKKKPGFCQTDADGSGSKWSFEALWAYLAKSGVDADAIWAQVHEIVAKTILAVEPKISSQVLHCLANRQLPLQPPDSDALDGMRMRPAAGTSL